MKNETTVKTVKPENFGRARAIHKLADKGTPDTVILAKLKRRGFDITPSLLKRIVARSQKHANN